LSFSQASHHQKTGLKIKIVFQLPKNYPMIKNPFFLIKHNVFLGLQIGYAIFKKRYRFNKAKAN